jgi:hypothetical protein
LERFPGKIKCFAISLTRPFNQVKQIVEVYVKTFFGVFRYEFKMSIKRWGVLVAFALMGLFYLSSFIAPTVSGQVSQVMTNAELRESAGHLAFGMNVLIPVLVGIAAADRAVRDIQLGVDELLTSTRLKRPVHVAGKYLGVLCSLLTPPLVIMMLVAVVEVAFGAPLIFFWYVIAAFLAIIVPTYGFVIAFSLACPLVMPVRVYQVLFTGYWFWGNFLNPDFFPSISDTLLNAAGSYALQGFFGTATGTVENLHTASEAVLNISVLAGCALIALVVMERFLSRRTVRAD